VKTAARAIAAGRIAFGVASMAAPRLTAGVWVGRDGTSDGATVLTRALGARDALLGLMALHTLDRPDVARRWQASLAACDAVDGLATLAARRSPAAAVFALSVAAGELAIARSLASPPGSSA
jgi:hypothetical protein